MEEDYQHRKQYCRPGESESHVALGVAIIWIVFCLVATPIVLWVFGLFTP